MKNILVLGNSVAAVAKPDEENILTYSDILSKSFKVTNLSKRASIISDDHFRKIKNKEMYDVVILNFGVVEACTRSTERKLYMFLYQNKLKWYQKPFRFFLSYFETKFRAYFVKKRGFRSWINSQEFKKHLSELITSFQQKNSNVKFIGISINKPSERINLQLPKSDENIEKFNIVYHQLAEQYDFPVFDSYEEIESANVPDGIHYNAKGHEIVADKLLTILGKYK